MEIAMINRHTEAILNTMFDNFYQVSVMTEHSGLTSASGELYTVNGLSIQLKHWATFLAIANEESDYSIQSWQYSDLESDFIVALEENGTQLIQILEAGYIILMEKVVTQN